MNIKNILLILILIHLYIIGAARNIDEIKRSGVIYVAITESAQKSINYSIALEFAKFLNVKLVVIPIKWDEIFSNDGVIPPNYQTDPSISYTPDALKNADFICGTIYLMPWREKFFDFAGIQEVSDLFIVPQKMNIRSYQDMKGLTIAFLENSSYENNINEINKKINGGINFYKTTSETESQQLLLDKKVHGMISVSHLALEFVNQNKNFKLAFPVAKPLKVAWAVENGNSGLQQEIDNFFETIQGNRKLDELFTSRFGVDYETYLDIINSFSDLIESNNRDLDEIMQTGKIVIALREAEFIYHEKGKKQFSHRLAEAFAKYLNLKLEIVIAPKLSNYFETEKGVINKDSSYSPAFFNTIDIACDVFNPLPWRLKKIDIIDFIPNAQVVIGRKNLPLFSINDLMKYRGVVAKGSSNEDVLIANNLTKYYYANTNQYLSDIQNNKADYALGSIALYSLPLYPQLEAKFIIGKIKQVGWGIKKNQPKLRQKILEFIEYSKKMGLLDELFNEQTGMPFKAAEDYLTALHQASQHGIFPFVFYGSNEGMPQEDILSIFQDKDGYIWYGNYEGAVKYNGRKMNDIKLSYHAASPVFDINQDANGTLYFASQKGITYIEENGEPKILLDNVSARKIYIDNQNNKWFITKNGLYLKKNNGKTELLNKKIALLPDRITSIAQGKSSNTFIISSEEGIYLLEQNNNLSKISDLESNFCYVDEKNNAWIATSIGLFHSPFNTLAPGKIGEKLNESLGIGDVHITNIYQTNDGAIWLLTDYKIIQIFTIYQKPIFYDASIGLKKQKILSFLCDNEQNFWIGYSGGLQKLTNKNLRLFFPSQINGFITSVVQDALGRIWIGSNRNIYHFKGNLVDATTLFGNSESTFLIAKAPENTVIVASQNSICKVDVNTLRIKEKVVFKKPIRNIQQIFVSSKQEIFLSNGIDGKVYYFENLNSEPKIIDSQTASSIHQIVEYKGKIYGGNNWGIVEFRNKEFIQIAEAGCAVWTLCPDKETLWLGTNKGLAKYAGKIKFISAKLPNNVINSIVVAGDNSKLWLGTNSGFCYFDKISAKIEFKIDSKDGLLGNEIAINGLQTDDKGLLWIATYHGLATFDVKLKKTPKFTPDCKIEKIWLNGKVIPAIDRVLSYDENSLVFELSGLSFKDEASVEYDFFLKGLDNDFGASTGREYRANYQNLPPGKYEFVYRTKGKDGIWSYYKSISFEIEKPFYQRWWFYLILIFVFANLIWGFIKWRERALRKQNEHLEELVKLRTFELEQQKEEIKSQRDEIESQRVIATSQRDEISIQKKDILDSIYYARRIQTAILTPKKVIFHTLPHHFILLRPRDIVSGDFYWIREKGNKIIVVAADCTGHGVPGAFMSMLGTAFLNEIASKPEIIHSNQILDELRDYVISSLHQTGRIDEAKDGMDVSLCIIDKNAMEMEYSGAFNPMYFIRDNQLIEYKADRMPIGIFDKYKPFTKQDIKLLKNDVFYIFSDGYHDQFGGEEGKKFMSNRMKKLLLDNHSIPMNEQRDLLDKTMNDWLAFKDLNGNRFEQIDDILVIGVRM